MTTYVPTEEEKREFIDALEETSSLLLSLDRNQLRATVARMCDAISVNPSTIVPELYQKLLSVGLAQREVSIAFGILIASAIDKDMAGKILSSEGIEAVKVEAINYSKAFKK